MARGDILLVDLPYPPDSGREQAGRRPAIVVQTDAAASTRLPTLMVVPLTSSLRNLRYPHTVLVNPSPSNGLTQPSVLLVFQLKAIDRRREIRLLGTLEQPYIDQLNDELRSLLGL